MYSKQMSAYQLVDRKKQHTKNYEYCGSWSSHYALHFENIQQDTKIIKLRHTTSLMTPFNSFF